MSDDRAPDGPEDGADKPATTVRGATTMRSASVKVADGGALAMLGSIFGRLLGMASLLILGRLLAPDDFGVIALALLVIGLSEALLGNQFHLALVRLHEVEKSHFDTAFTMGMIFGLTFAALIFFSAEPVAMLMDEPRLVPVLRILSILPILNGLYNPYFAVFEREINLVPNVLIESGAATVRAGVAILLAVLWGDHWALVVGVIAMYVMRTVLTHVTIPRRIGFSLVHAKDFLAFGGWLTATGLVGFIIFRSDAAMVGALLPTATVGVYNMGVELSIILTEYVAITLSQSIYPGLSSVAADPARLKRAYYRAQEVLLGVMLPIGVGLALVSHETILALLGEQWIESAQVVSILAPAMAVATLVYGVQAVLMVKGETKAMFQRNLIVASAQLPLMALGLWWFGLIGVIVARVLAIAMHVTLSLMIVTRWTDDPLLETVFRARRSIISVAAMTVAVLLISMMTTAPADSLEALPILILKATLGAAVYVGAHFALWRAAGSPDGVEETVMSFARRLLGKLRLVAMR